MRLEIDYQEVPIVVDCDYQPYEQMTHDSPGCDEYFTVNDVFIGEICATAIFSMEQISEIEQILLNTHGRAAKREAAQIDRYEDRMMA